MVGRRLDGRYCTKRLTLKADVHHTLVLIHGKTAIITVFSLAARQMSLNGSGRTSMKVLA